MKTTIAGIVITIIMLIGCQQTYVTVPSFEIKVDLDKKAEKELRARKETIMVSVEFSGTPRKDAWVSVNKASGLILGFFQKELDSEGVVKFENLQIPESRYQALEKKDYNVSVDVGSGWKSSKFNLLNCEPFGSVISRLAGKQHTIKCKLLRDEQENYVTVPSFEIKVDLDERAEKELRARKETIIVEVGLLGTPRKDSELTGSKDVGLPLDYFKRELDNEGVVKVEGMKIPEKLYQALENKDYGVSVRVRSGWKSSKVNLLNCEPFGSVINEIAGKQYVIRCKLIKDGE